jgi:hypothetical protein
MPTVAVIGGGLQGAGLAIELSMRGFRIELFEKRDECLSQASLNNEGKVHLGFVYAGDRSLETARLLSRGGFRFAPVLQRWLESSINLRVSLPFHYVVHRESQIASDELEAIYLKIGAINREHSAIEGNHYLGREVFRPMQRLDRAEAQALVDPSLISDVFKSPELAVDPIPLTTALRRRLADDPAITVHTKTAVTAVERLTDRVKIMTGLGSAGNWHAFDQVINTTWEDLVFLDNTAGIAAQGKWCFRVKYFLRGRLFGPAALCPSATIVLGPFGDVVQFTDGEFVLSWYPVGRRQWSDALRLDIEAMSLTSDEKEQVGKGILEGLARIFPESLGRCDLATAQLDLKGGIILALGSTDIDQKDSQLHKRSQIGPRSFGRYHTVDTGKWTMAPLFAEILSARIAHGYA